MNQDLAEGEVGDDSPIAKAVRTTTKAQAKAKSVVEHIASQIFQLYSNFLLEEAWQPWNKILAKQIDSSPWKDSKFQIPVGILQNSEFCRKLLPIRPEPSSDVMRFLFNFY